MRDSLEWWRAAALALFVAVALTISPNGSDFDLQMLDVRSWGADDWKRFSFRFLMFGVALWTAILGRRRGWSWQKQAAVVFGLTVGLVSAFINL